METAQIREKLQSYINQADDRFIYLVYGMMKEDKKGTVIYTVKGKSLTQRQYKEDIDKARAQYKDGNYITQEELEKKTKNW